MAEGEEKSSPNTAKSFFGRNMSNIQNGARRIHARCRDQGFPLDVGADDLASETAKKITRAYFSAESTHVYTFQGEAQDKALIKKTLHRVVIDERTKHKSDSLLLVGISLDAPSHESDDERMHKPQWADPQAEQEFHRVDARETLLVFINQIPNELYQDILRKLLNGEELEKLEGYSAGYICVAKARAIAALQEQILERIPDQGERLAILAD